MRRYFVVNGFDGALTMLGIMVGLKASDQSDAGLALNACIGAAVALGASGLSSAYVSESAERRKALQDLESAMIADLSASEHGAAARLAPIAVAAVNGFAPLAISLVITAPLWYRNGRLPFGWAALDLALAIAFAVIFLLGAFLGRISGRFWLLSGVQTVLIAAATTAVIALVSP